MNYPDASIRGIKSQKNKIPNSKNEKYAASRGELDPKRLNMYVGSVFRGLFPLSKKNKILTFTYHIESNQLEKAFDKFIKSLINTKHP